jgi:AraC-like DNA-binding protein
MLPVMMGFIFYYGAVTTVRQETENLNYAALSQAGKEMDYIEGEMKNIAYHFSSYMDDDRFLRDAAEIYTRIKAYEDSLSFDAQILFYLRGSSAVYLSSGIVNYRDLESYISNMEGRGDMTMSSFFTNLNKYRHDTSQRISHSPFLPVKAQSSLAYMFPVPALSVMPKAVICFLVKGETIHEIIETYLGETNANIYFFNDTLDCLYKRETLNLGKETPKDLVTTKGVGVMEYNYNGRPLMIIRAVSENTGSRLISVSTKKDFYARIFPMQKTLIISIVILALTGCVAALMLTRRNYKPIQRLLNNIGGDPWNTENREGTEFDYIMDKFNLIEEANQEQEAALDKQRPIVLYSCLQKLLKGEYVPGDETEMYLGYAGVSLQDPWYFVLILSPLRTEENDRPLSRKIQEILSSVDGAKHKDFRLYEIELVFEQQVAVIGNSRVKIIEADDIRIIAARFLEKTIGERFGLGVKISGGRVYNSKGGISASFIEAKVIMADYLLGRRKIMFFEEAENTGVGNFWFPVYEESMYVQSVRQANRESALKAVDAMIAKIGEEESSPITQFLCADIVNMMIKILGELGMSIALPDLKELSRYSSLEQFRRKAGEITETICTGYEKALEIKQSSLKMEILNYINSNFCDSQFSLQGTADHFDVSPSWLSRFFKQETGQNFIKYISDLRMSRVKELLVYTDRQVKDIVSEVGYMDAPSFLRKFKAAEGKTPGQYREQAHKTQKIQTGKNGTSAGQRGN